MGSSSAVSESIQSGSKTKHTPNLANRVASLFPPREPLVATGKMADSSAVLGPCFAKNPFAQLAGKLKHLRIFCQFLKIT